MIYGVGVNDSDYSVESRVKGKTVWVCPIYSCWRDMLTRCYSHKYIDRHETYRDCVVCDEWKLFSTFKKWMETQDWKGKQLDKDILFKGNKRYSPETCVFVDAKTNTIFVKDLNRAGKYLLGVSFDKTAKRIKACCKDGNGSNIHLGYFDDESKAHKAYLNFKSGVVEIRAKEQTDKRVFDALMSRANEMKQQAAAL